MEEMEPFISTRASDPTPSSPLSSDTSASPAELIASLEKNVMSSMDSLVDHLQSLHQEGTLDKDALKSEVNQVSQLAQAILLIRVILKSW